MYKTIDNLQQYIEFTRTVSIYPNVGDNLIYPSLGLLGEYGEICEKFKKIIRDENGIISVNKKQEIIKELGDVCFYIARLIDESYILNYNPINIMLEYFKNDNNMNKYDINSIIINNINEISEFINITKKYKYLYNTCKFVIKNKPLDCSMVYDYELLKDEDDTKNLLKKYILNMFKIIHFISEYLDTNLDEVLNQNVSKLSDRKSRNVINGSGDNR